MNRDDPGVLAALEQLYAEIRGERRDLRASDRLVEDLSLDSLAAAELASAAEHELGVALIDDDRLPLARTVGDLLEIIEQAKGRATWSEEETLI